VARGSASTTPIEPAEMGKPLHRTSGIGLMATTKLSGWYAMVLNSRVSPHTLCPLPQFVNSIEQKAEEVERKNADCVQ
jgi:hypothetical protein